MATETPTTRSTRRPDTATTKIAVGLVVLLALIGLIVAVTSSKSSSSPLLLSSSTPMRVTVPSIDTTSTLIPLGQQPDGELAVPPLSNPKQASWYDKSPMPGTLGPAVVLGHINGDGKPGVFANLSKVQAGQQVMIDRADGQTAVFTVSHVDTVPKDNFPSQAVYGDTADSELRLITCGGVLDRAAHNYLSNVVVFANLTAVHKT